MNHDEWYHMIDFASESDFPSILCVCSEWNTLLGSRMKTSNFWIWRHVNFLSSRIVSYSKLITKEDSSSPGRMIKFIKKRIDHHYRKIQELQLRNDHQTKRNNFGARHLIAVKKYEDWNNCIHMMNYLYYRNDDLAVECFINKDISKLVSDKYGEIFRFLFESFMNVYHYRKLTMEKLYYILKSFIRYSSNYDLKFWVSLLDNHPNFSFSDSDIQWLDSDFLKCYALNLNHFSSFSSDYMDELAMKFFKVHDYRRLEVLSIPMQLRLGKRIVKILKDRNLSYFNRRRTPYYFDIPPNLYSPNLSQYLDELSSNRDQLVDFFHEEFIFVGKFYTFRDYKVDYCGKSSNGVNWIVNLIDNFPHVDLISIFSSPVFCAFTIDWIQIDSNMNLLNRIILETEDPSDRLSIIKGFRNKNVLFTNVLLEKIIDSSNYGIDNKKSSTIREMVLYLFPLVVFEYSNAPFEQFYNMHVDSVKGNNWHGTDCRLELCYKVWKIIG